MTEKALDELDFNKDQDNGYSKSGGLPFRSQIAEADRADAYQDEYEVWWWHEGQEEERHMYEEFMYQEMNSDDL